MAQPTAIKSDSKSREAELKDIYAVLEVLKEDMKQLSKTVSDVGKAEAERAVNTAKDKGREVRKAGEEQVDALRATAEDYGRATGNYIRENPTSAVGIAAGLGFLLGFFLSSRR